MDSRLELHEMLCAILNKSEPDGDRHTYFDPPASVKMKYPAIRYARQKIGNLYANNIVYKHLKPYEIILIDEDPDSVYLEKILQLPYCVHENHYTADNLHHDVLTLYHD